MTSLSKPASKPAFPTASQPNPRRLINADTLSAWLGDSDKIGNEIALIDIREEGEFGEGHPLFATNIPYSRLERDVARLVPRRATRIVLVGDTVGDTGPVATRRLASLGYRDVHELSGGAPAWAAAGNRLHTSIHVPSKAFAEVVEHSYHTPAIKAEALAKLFEDKADVVVLDSRTLEEYERFHVPNAISCPSAELVYRFDDLVPSPETLVVVSCAGRTRGIIGAQALINGGVPNKVVALEGGTQGWKLANLPVEKGLVAKYGPVSDRARARALVRSTALSERFEVPHIALADFQAWLGDEARTTYLVDVRTAEEYAAGHLDGAIHVAGGQLVQTLDKWLAVRGARVVLADDHQVRADVTAHWLRQLGWDASVLAYDPTRASLVKGSQPSGAAPEPLQPVVDELDSVRAAALLSQGAVALSGDSSQQFRAAHPAGATWVNRSRLNSLPIAARSAPTLLLFGHDDQALQLIALDLRERNPSQQVFAVRGDVDAWRAAGIAVEATPDLPADAQRIDFLFWLHDRHLGNAEASRAYLAWEGELPKLIGSPAQAGFRIPAHVANASSAATH
ncbi:rhodanese-related sulfurtransferase [soil metagenome]